MKNNLKLICLFLLCSFSNAATFPTITPEIKQERESKRLMILQEELKANNLYLKEAQEKLDKSPNDKKLADTRNLYQANVRDLNKEISATLGLRSSPAKQKVATAITDKDKSESAKVDNLPTAQKQATFEAWDVFNHFPQGTKHETFTITE